MSCNNNSSGFCAFGSNWWWVIIWNGNGNGNGCGCDNGCGC